MLQRTCPSVSALTSLESPAYGFWNVPVIRLSAGVVTACNRRTLQAFPKVEKNPRSNENEEETSQLERLSSWLVSTSFSFDLGLFSTFSRFSRCTKTNTPNSNSTRRGPA